MTLKEANQQAYEMGAGGWGYYALFNVKLNTERLQIFEEYNITPPERDPEDPPELPDKFFDNEDILAAYNAGKLVMETEYAAKYLPKYIEHLEAGGNKDNFNPKGWTIRDKDDYYPIDEYLPIWNADPATVEALAAATAKGVESIKVEKRNTAKNFSNLAHVLPVSVASPLHNKLDGKSLAVEIDTVVEDLKSGNNDFILKHLVGNLLSMQVESAFVQAPDNAPLKTKKEVINMRVRMAQEARKTALAIDNITNPRNTTFVKNATQNNITTVDKPAQIDAPIEVEIDIVPEPTQEKTLKEE